MKSFIKYGSAAVLASGATLAAIALSVPDLVEEAYYRAIPPISPKAVSCQLVQDGQLASTIRIEFMGVAEPVHTALSMANLSPSGDMLEGYSAYLFDAKSFGFQNDRVSVFLNEDGCSFDDALSLSDGRKAPVLEQ